MRADPITDEMVRAGWRAWVDRTLPCQRIDGPDEGGFDEGDDWCDGRQSAFIAAHLMAARTCPGGVEGDPARLDEPIRRVVGFLLRRQHPDGRLDLNGSYGANEVGFTLPSLVEGYRAIAALTGSPLGDVLPRLETFLRRGAEAVEAGEAYTANHRWAAAAAPLAAVHAVWPDERYLTKIESYLADGIDCAPDGCWYVELSPNYNMVANHGLLVMADELGRPELAEPVLRNLEFVLHCLQPNGEIDSSFSHRQDRARPDRPATTYVVARRAAQLSGDGRIAALAADGWRRHGVEVDLMPPLFALERHPEPMPAPTSPPTRYERTFPSCSVTRIRHDDTALTLAADPGGHFFDTVRDQWGGPRRSDSWFHLQYGEIVIETLHLAVTGMANIQPTELLELGENRYRLSGAVDGWTHSLHFRPGKRDIRMPWDWEHDVQVAWRDGGVNVRLSSATPHALRGTLHLWVRPGVVVDEAGSMSAPLAAGDAVALRGGSLVILRSAGWAIEVRGLPVAEHGVTTRHPPSIPSAVEECCADLTLGLRLPVDLDLDLRLLRTA